MALRLRRGTNTERQTATFSEGELIYVTDYESAGVSPLWIGDGSTVGGNEVETGGTPTLALNDLTDVNALAIENNVLVYKGSQWTSVDPATLGIGGSGIVEGQEYNISINGSVIGSDSSIIVDHITQVVTANLFVGSGAGLTDINLVDLEDVFAFGAQINDVLTYDGIGWIPRPAASSIVEGIEYNINIQGDVLGLDSSILVNSATNTFSGTFVGDISGSVFSDDSTLMVDALSNTLNGTLKTNNIQGLSDTLNLDNDLIGSFNVRVVSNDNQSILKLNFSNALADLSTSGIQYGSLYFERSDISGDATTSFVSGGSNFLFLAVDDGSLLFPESNYITMLSSGNVGFGTYTPQAKVDIRGGTLRLANLSTTQRNALSAANGDMIYNTTANRIQAFQNGAWINLDDGTAA